MHRFSSQTTLYRTKARQERRCRTRLCLSLRRRERRLKRLCLGPRHNPSPCAQEVQGCCESIIDRGTAPKKWKEGRGRLWHVMRHQAKGCSRGCYSPWFPKAPQKHCASAQRNFPLMAQSDLWNFKSGTPATPLLITILSIKLRYSNTHYIWSTTHALSCNITMVS